MRVRGKKVAFTLAEVKDLPAPDGEGVRRTEGVISRKVAFTLAEVLITLGIIGVVSAITLPALFTNITGYVNTKRQENIGQKVTQAMEQMRAHGLLNTQYASTDAFVDELQKYLKIAKRCDSEHVADCWPTPVVTTGEGEEYEVSQAKIGKHLSLESESNNVGLILADGASIILNYNPNAPAVDVGDKVQWLEGLPQYTTSVTGAIDFVMDVNGGKSPNSEKAGDKRDIRPFKIAQFSEVDTCKGGVNVPGVGCVVELGGAYNWFGAKNACEAKGMTLPDIETLRLIYDSHAEGLLTYYYVWVWSSTVDSSNKATEKYFGGGSEYNNSKTYEAFALCVGN
ncbi:hypothetical protein J6P92_02920 [bacterium]|nr:hypothetical protein [bacterium]